MFTQEATRRETTNCLVGVVLQTMESAFDRLLRAAIELKPGVIANKSDLAKYLNESPQSITNWQSRGIPKGKLLRVALSLGLSPRWLDSGEGDMKILTVDHIVPKPGKGAAYGYSNLVAADNQTFPHEKFLPHCGSDKDGFGPAIQTPQRPVVVVESDEDIQHEVFAIPRYKVKASAGSGEPVFEIDTEGTPNYCRSGWALKNGFKPDSLFSIVAAGDSMEPTIPDGASLIVHRTSEIANGKVHVICRGTQCYVKRLFAQMDGSVLVRSDNQDVYKDLTVSPDDTDALHVVGLVVSVSFNL